MESSNQALTLCLTILGNDLVGRCLRGGYLVLEGRRKYER